MNRFPNECPWRGLQCARTHSNGAIMAKDILSIVTRLAPPWVLFCDEGHLDVTSLHAQIDLHGGLIRELDGHQSTTRESFYDQLTRAFDFPDYFGKNFNALDDCITDLGWLPVHGPILLLIHHPEMLLLDSPDDSLCGFIEILNDAGESWSRPVEVGECWDRPAYPFHVVLLVNQVTKNTLLTRLSNCAVQLQEACG